MINVHPKPDLGQYFTDDGENVTNRIHDGGVLEAGPEGVKLTVNEHEGEPPGRGHGTLTHLHPFRKGDWHWNNKDLGDSVVSVEHGPYHYYTMRAKVDTPLHLRTFDENPHMRPETYGELDFGEPVSSLMLRGREHPVYDQIHVHERGSRFGKTEYSMQGEAPWIIDEDGNPIVGNWGQYHAEIGSGNGFVGKGIVDRNGHVWVMYPPENREKVFDHVAPALQQAFGPGFYPELESPDSPFVFSGDPEESWFNQPDAPSKPPETPSKGFVATLKGLGRVWRSKTGEVATGPRYHLMTPEPSPVDNRGFQTWSGLKDAYRYMVNADGHYIEQPEEGLRGGHGYGHPGLSQEWRSVWPDLPPLASSSFNGGWHFPLVGGGRGIMPYRNQSPSDDLNQQAIAQIEAHHGVPARLATMSEGECYPEGGNLVSPRHPVAPLDFGVVPQKPPLQ